MPNVPTEQSSATRFASRSTAGVPPSAGDRVELRLGDRPSAQRFVAYLEGLRGLAALYVVVYHADRALTHNRPRSSQLVPFAGQFLHYGHFAVALFIVISGYVLAIPLFASGSLPGGAKAFFKRRARRLLPEYYAALALALPLAAYNDRIDGVFSMRSFGEQLAAHILLVHDFFGSKIIYGLDGALWTVAVEVQIYVVFALLLVPVWKRHGIAPVVALAVGLGLVPTVAGIAHHHAAAFVFGRSCFWFLGLFGFGMAAASVPHHERLIRLPWAVIAAVPALAFITLNATFGARTVESNQTLLCAADLLLGLAVAATFALVTQQNALDRRPIVARVLGSRPCIALGSFSYSLYLTHEPLVEAAVHVLARTHLPDGAVVALVYAVVVPLLVAFAFGFSILFERPFLSSFRRSSEGRMLGAARSAARA